jgi:integrase
MGISNLDPGAHERRPWNAGSLVGAKRPLKPRDVWAIRFFLDEHRRMRDRALFDLAIDSKLRGCDVIKLKIGDVVSGGSIRNRATVVQQKTRRPVQFELMADCRKSLLAWLERRGGSLDDFVFPSRVNRAGHLSTRQYARLVDEWTRERTAIGLLAPDIQRALLTGKAPLGLDPEKLLSRDMPLDWEGQRKFLGMKHAA